MSRRKRKQQIRQAGPNWPVIGGVGLLVVLLFFGFYAAGSGEEYYDLASCMTEAGATMYGAHWCPHCAEQKRVFGLKAFKNIDYVECATGGPADIPATPELCREKEISNYPTWIFPDNSRVTGAQSLEFLAQKTGCQAVLNQ